MRVKWCRLLIVAVLGGFVFSAQAKNPYRKDFFKEYKKADGTQLSTLPSAADHCGLCHYDFSGSGPRNFYGQDVEAQLDAGNDATTAFQNIEALDSDGDGHSNLIEITDDATTYDNTPTFPGYTAANVGSTINVDTSDLTDYLTPSSGIDTNPPSVTLLSPNGGETATGNAGLLISWSASDAGGIAGIDLYISLDNGSNYTPIAFSLPNNPSNFVWFVSNRPSSNALIKIEATDFSLNEAEDESDAEFTIVAPAGGTAPTTLRDFDLPGSQPLEHSGLSQADPDGCAACHGNYNEFHEPYRNWMGSMMAQASIDPIFKANMAIANQDAPDSGDLCLRCHNSRGWLDGRSTPTDGSQMNPLDQRGVSCDLCHRLVDPHFVTNVSPAVDYEILDELDDIPPEPGNGMVVFDPDSHRRGPYDITESPHVHLHSPYHKEAAICGTCHDVSNPVFERDGDNAEYVANNFDEAPATSNNTPKILMPVERTYSEWLHSAYNTAEGVYAPKFAGDKMDGRVSTCQDCHMPDVLGYGADPAQYPEVPLRGDLPLHDMTGGSSWLPNLLPDLAGLDAVEAQALSNGADRAVYMLQNAARMETKQVGDELKVMVINDTGHKLPTGYPEGRRIWVNLSFYDVQENLIQESGGYDYTTGLLTNDTRIYEIHPGIGENLAAALGVDPGPSLHFVLNNQIYEDNRIPPRGFTNSVFATFGGEPVGHHYDDGQYWDDTYFEIPDGAVRAHAKLFYQSTSKEFVEFLYTNNVTDAAGTNLYNLWVANDMCPPVLMTEAFWPEDFTIESMSWMAGDSLGIIFNSVSGYTYWVEYTDDLGSSNLVWIPFISNGVIDSLGGTNLFIDDFTPATSGEAPPDGHRFYRIQR